MMSWRLSSRVLSVLTGTLRTHSAASFGICPRCRSCLHDADRRDAVRWHSVSADDTHPLHRAAGQGDLDQLDKLLKVPDMDLDARDRLGWSPLMHAVHGDRPTAVERLLAAGCNPALRSYYDHSASEMARFWERRECLRLLADRGVPHTEKVRPVFFSGGPLARTSGVRTDSALMAKLRTCGTARYLLSYKSGVVLEESEREGRGGRKRKSHRLWVRTSAELQAEGVSVDVEDYVFLGFDGNNEADKTTVVRSAMVGKPDDGVESYGTPVFVLPLEKDTLSRLQEGRTLVLSTNILNLLKVSPREAAIAAQAIGMVDWLWRYRICATCGSDTVVREAGYKRQCQNEACSSNRRLRNTTYPRSDVSVIVAVTSPDGGSLLMVRPPRLYPGMFTCPSGYLEPGETLEDTCRREVFEETGLRLGDVTYHASQFWPNPAVLMTGFIGTAKNDNIKLDTEELEQGRWFRRPEAADAMTLVHSEGLSVVPPYALGHQLIKAWLLDTARTD